MRLDVIREVAVSTSGRARQLEGMFDVPRVDLSRVEWHGDVDTDAQPWSVGLIVGPSGSGKTTLLGEMFGEPAVFPWHGASCVDDFDPAISMDDIAATCQAVGFNTIPAWMRPYSELSNGEQFRAGLARALLEDARETIVLDEFTSVVDRQVAQIGSYAVQKFIRRHERRLVVASCHYDIIDWLEPDWVLDAATLNLTWRRHRGRPSLDVTISPTDYATWRLFAPFHYLTADLNHAARCFCLFVGDEPAAFGAVLHQPHNKTKNLKRLSRLVTLPDWQGLGLAFVLSDRLAAAYKADGVRYRTYPAHPALIHAFDRSENYAMVTRPATFGAKSGQTSGLSSGWHQGKRPCAVFEWCGPADEDAAELLLHRRT